MGEWNEKFGGQFRQVREDARLAEQRQHEKSDLLKTEGPKLWEELKDDLQAAAKDISTNEGFLTYNNVATETAADEVSLVYSLATGSRTAAIALTGNDVKLIITEPARTLLSDNYEIAINLKGDGVWFSQKGRGGKTSKELVSLVLRGLVAAH